MNLRGQGRGKNIPNILCRVKTNGRVICCLCFPPRVNRNCTLVCYMHVSWLGLLQQITIDWVASTTKSFVFVVPEAGWARSGSQLGQIPGEGPLLGSVLTWRFFASCATCLFLL